MSSHPTYRWQYPKPLPVDIQRKLEVFTKPFQSILFQRGIKSVSQAADFLLPELPKWSPATNLLHVDQACQLIKQAVDKQVPIGIFGDYDADGITATALLTLALRKIHPSVYPVIPNRVQDGYGISIDAIDDFCQNGVGLVITADNGIRAGAESSYAKKKGIELIITDHHTPGDKIPSAAAVLNPKLPADSYPNKELAGVGVAYKLICGLAELFPILDPDSYLDLVALGTIADIVPLTGENRYLVKQGLRLLTHRPRQAIYSLLGVSGLTNQPITAEQISFQIAPRINASGRLGSADHLAPLKLLLSEDPAVCGKLAQTLENHNRQRKMISRKLQKRLEKIFKDQEDLPFILIAFDKQVDLGVAGIAAGYLARKFNLPAVVGKIEASTTTASCRSIPGFDMISALDDLQNLFLHYGGHALAAGFTIENQYLDSFQGKLQQLAKKDLGEVDLQPELHIDAMVNLSDLNQSLFKEISKLEPTGPGNPQPVFAARKISASGISRVGKDKAHLKFLAGDGTSAINAIGFNLGGTAIDLNAPFDIAFHYQENYFRGKKSFQLQILDIQQD